MLAPNSFTCLGSPCPIPASGNRPGEIPFANVERPCSLKLNLPDPIIPHQAAVGQDFRRPKTVTFGLSRRWVGDSLRNPKVSVKEQDGVQQ